jgi:hypothetical protein
MRGSLLINNYERGWCSLCYLSTKDETVTETVLGEVFEVLRSIGAVRSESEFSRDWLGRSECYLRSLRFNGLEPSVSSVAVCASKLQHYGARMCATKEHEQLGKRFLRLAEQCHKQINAAAEQTWMAAL